MSISVMDRVWRNSKSRKGELLIMLAIADFANDNGEAWPSVPTLANKSRLSERQAQYALRRLVRSGELELSKNKGPRGCHLYRITIAVSTGAEIAPVQKLRGAVSDTRGAVSGTLGVQYPAPEPSVNRHKNRHVQQEVDSDFIAQQQSHFPHLNVDMEAGKARAWISVNPPRRMTPKFFISWLNRAKPQPGASQKEEW